MAERQLDDLSLKMGKLIAVGEARAVADASLAEEMRTLWTKIDALREDVIKAGGVAEAALRISGENREKIKTEIMPTVVTVTALRHKGLGILATVGFLGSALTAIAGLVAWAMGLFGRG